MAKCWTCGTDVDTATYTCGACENSSTLAILRRAASAHAEAVGEVTAIERSEADGPTAAAERAEADACVKTAGAAEIVDAAAALQQIQEQGAHELREAMRSLSRVSSVMPEWRAVMTRMLEARGIIGLASAIRWGFGELSWQAHQASDVLASIDRSLRSPSATQADEWRQMAEELRRRGVLREAEEFYLKALELNRLDYRIYVGLAETFIRDSRFEDAVRMLERSLPHAPADDIDYRSHSLRLLGHIRECEGDYVRACEALGRAVALSPDYVEARYDHAQYAAQTGEREEAIASLREVLLARPSYWYLANAEPNFDPVRPDVDDLLERLKTEARIAASDTLRRAESAVREAGDAADRVDALLGPASARRDPDADDDYAIAVATIERGRVETASEDYLTVLGAEETLRGAVTAALRARDRAVAETEDLRSRISADFGGDAAAVADPSEPKTPRPSAVAVESAPTTCGVPAEPESLAAGGRRVLRILLGGLKSAGMFTPIAAFVFAVAGFMHGSIVMDIDNLDAPFVYLWGYVSRGTVLATGAAFLIGSWRARGRETRQVSEGRAAEA